MTPLATPLKITADLSLRLKGRFIVMLCYVLHERKKKNTTHIHGIVLTLYNKRGRGQIRSPQGSYSRGFLIFLHWQFSKKPFASNRQVEKNKKRSKSGTTSLELELQLKFVYYQPCNYEIVQTTTTLQKQTLCTLPTYLYML